MIQKSALADVSESLSAFERAIQLQAKAAAVGFDWPQIGDIRNKIKEELLELEKGLDNQDAANTFEELGDVLFALTNLARRLEIDPAAALEATNKKFIRRFQHMEQAALDEGSDLASEPLTQQVIRYRQAWAEDQCS